jgi:hypothetical protein
MATGATAGYFLQTDASGNASWQSLGTLPGDNLGNHTATIDLNMSNKKIVNVSTISVTSITFNDGTVDPASTGVYATNVVQTEKYTCKKEYRQSVILNASISVCGAHNTIL